MKKIVLFVAMLVIMSVVVFAQQGIHEPGTGIEDPELKEGGQGTGQGSGNATGTGVGDGTGDESGTQTKAKVTTQAQEGNFKGEGGQQMTLEKQANNRLTLKVGGVSVDCPADMKQEQVQDKTKLYIGLSNARQAEIKVMPNEASETALQKLKLNNCDENCNIELKEGGSKSNPKAAYEIKTQRSSKVLGLFQAKMQVQAQVDAETGEVLQVSKPWWAFLATEAEE